MFEIFLSKLKFLLKSPMVLFTYGIISKWYILVMVPAVVVTFWIFKGLTEAGILQTAEKIVVDALQDSKSVAQHCVPKILSFGDFWECLQNPPSYTPSKEEVLFEKGAKDLLDFENYNRNKDPYAE
ncbi:MAG: DUF2670 domain-containing protein [Rickettsiales bacterium]|nr:MAG: DUF2670 domain-containing protein [Rickettsiales bacterium]